MDRYDKPPVGREETAKFLEFIDCYKRLNKWQQWRILILICWSAFWCKLKRLFWRAEKEQKAEGAVWYGYQDQMRVLLALYALAATAALYAWLIWKAH